MKRKNIKWLLVVVWMIVIFVFSSMNGDSSDEKSKFVIYIFNLLGLNLNGIFGTLADFIVRKCAHFTEYFILYMLLYNALKENFSFKKALLFSIIGVFLYASSDEFHQSFVPGRGPSFRDVCIDTSGGLLALVILYLNVTFKKRPSKFK
ncbi:VanZ family protein [Clostridium sp. YIM B02515]|uniref:VanZ family protein n=1 Tax=Clostridium rhizosphaerae TaxID=2803861 RepID=A0ABS1TH25_9CLOT|nr:VanZ family protein [Clostridium rhizosphaerae]MBL4938671.1 VanZ family protein [Clostridium rhizosphaerae]